MKNFDKENFVKTLKLIFALGLAAALFAGCSKSETNTNSSNTSNTKASSSPATTTTTTTTASTPANNSSSSSSSGEGQPFTHQEGGIQFVAPPTWKAKNEGESLVVSTPDNTLSVVFWVPEGDDFNKATGDLQRQLEKVIKNLKVTSPGQETTHNGMRAYTGSGTGEVEGEQIVWEVDILQARKPVFVVSFASPAQFDKHADEYKQLLASIKKVE
jgi:predicted Zn-dependent protease